MKGNGNHSDFSTHRSKVMDQNIHFLKKYPKIAHIIGFKTQFKF